MNCIECISVTGEQVSKPSSDFQLRITIQGASYTSRIVELEKSTDRIPFHVSHTSNANNAKANRDTIAWINLILPYLFYRFKIPHRLCRSLFTRLALFVTLVYGVQVKNSFFQSLNMCIYLCIHYYIFYNIMHALKTTSCILLLNQNIK